MVVVMSHNPENEMNEFIYCVFAFMYFIMRLTIYFYI